MQEPEPSVLSPESSHWAPDRPTSPDSQMTNSLYRANATIDELTATLAKVSRAPTPDALDRQMLQCCCGRAECVNTTAWAAFQSKLESRLILCAEVGQALLEKHEAYLRRHGLDDHDTQTDEGSDISRPETPTIHSGNPDLQYETLVSDLRRENSILQKRLNTALLNSEIAETSKKSLFQELEEAKGAISKLTVSQARSTGWENRVDVLTQERDDLRQELESERQRLKSSESHVMVLKERCIKLQSEIGRLYDDLDQQKQSRTELSEEILRDARVRLQMVQQQQFGRSMLSESPEVTQMMESLVADNEALKRDVAELQNLLTESREDVRTLEEEVEQSRITSGSSRRVSSSSRPGHNHAHSWASSFGQAPLSPVSRNTAHSTQPCEPLTPHSEARALSPPVSRTTSERHSPALTSPRPKCSPSHLNLDLDDRNLRTRSPDFPGRKSPRRPLLLLTQNKAVQTDDVNWSSLLSPVIRVVTDDGSSATPPGDGRSESSSLAEFSTHASTIAAVVDRTNSLFSRISQADARTLMNRLKRQRLAGDVSHLSHATVSSIISDANTLRTHFRGVLEDERAVSTCTRRDLRALLSLLREMFGELGQMRITLNDIILDPSLAAKFSEATLNPSTEFNEAGGRGTKHALSNASAWITPLSKLFGGTSANQINDKQGDGPSTSSRPMSASPGMNATVRQKPPKVVTKSGPALAATATTVNVEFSGSGVGRSVASSATLPVAATGDGEAAQSITPIPGTNSSRTVMSIFAGAPQPQSTDAWVFVASKADRRIRSKQSTMDMRTATLTRSVGKRAGARLPRSVDAVIDSKSAVHDSDEDGERGSTIPDTLLERTLRPRGLSDSSIRSTFLKEENIPVSPTANAPQAPAPTPISPVPVRSVRGMSALRQSAYPAQESSRPSVLQAFSRAFAIPALSVSSTFHSSPPASLPSRLSETTMNRAASPRGARILPSIAGWAASHAGLDADAAENFVESVRDPEDEAHFGRRTWHRDMQGRDI